MQVQDLLARTDKLPNLPDVVRDLILEFKDPDPNHVTIAKKIAHDQTLSLKVLRVVNSAYFGLSRKVSSLEEATLILGTERLKTLVIASGFLNSVSQVDGINLKSFWADSFRVAELSHWLAKQTNKVNSDTAFTVGIVYNVGRLLLHVAKPELAKEIQDHVTRTKANRSQIETEKLGFTTQDAAQALIDQWKLPAEIGEAVRLYKRPLAPRDVEPLACILHLACYLNMCIRTEREREDTQEGFPLEVAQVAGISSSIIREIGGPLEAEGSLEQMLL